MKQGFFITLEGNDGAGKTTIAQACVERLKALGHEVVYTREPGGSRIAERIRDLLLDPGNTDMDARTEAILYAAARRQHLVDIVAPALEQGKIVLCDRFLDSSLAYQGIGRGLGIEEVERLNRFAIDDFMPDRTIFLAIDNETAMARMGRRGEKNRLDREDDAFHQRVREGYEKLVLRDPDRIVKIDASGSIEEVTDAAMKVIESVIYG
ncbi:dTMP kinase [Dubosiella muris]|uniref:dTMP kinase n=1 Tax=Dubosiella muris TaxID=3038133 RepID=A0AC61R7Q8_9FIRM|nr:dTMP kinase [Dubosiella muris]TGY65927.1 dTMP kinase [Dubosiella muris]